MTYAIPLISLFLQILALAFCLTFGWVNWRAWRRQVALNALLQEICTQAWMLRHMPIWTAWSDMTGISFRVVPDMRKPPSGGFR